MKILLTGGSGFIGSKILNKLISNNSTSDVIALTSKQLNNVKCIIYKNINDFGLDKDYFNDITHIIHAGAFIPKNTFEANDQSKCLTNIEYTKELLSFNFKKIEAIIHLSTVDVYASTHNRICENSKIDPISLYGASKFFNEKLVKYYADERGIKHFNLRIGHVYGPGEEKYKKVLPNAIRNVLLNTPIELWGDGSDLRSFIFIDDVVETVINALNTTSDISDINVVSANSISIKDLLTKIIEISGKNLEILQKPSTHKKRDLVFDNTILISNLLKNETDLTEGLKIEYEYMKKLYENNI
jgi:UDP-glucose 4-epimerase